MNIYVKYCFVKANVGLTSGIDFRGSMIREKTNLLDDQLRKIFQLEGKN